MFYDHCYALNISKWYTGSLREVGHISINHIKIVTASKKFLFMFYVREVNTFFLVR